ncbi:hypothetical protein DRH27_06090 [Candidatus Falkowbacteria bacterium]|nr:MAG: hypothetical protein DRH27_06090 [Candidatus Falkowbacteria bacterium]
MSKTCSVCGERSYSDFCFRHKPRKRISQKGRKTLEYEVWRDTVAIPHLNEKGRRCALCGSTKRLDVDHIKKRGSHPELRMELSNVRFLCRSCHINET